MSPRALFPSLVACVLSLFLAPPALAAEPAEDVLVRGYNEFDLQLIGWSQDEQRFVFRIYARPNPYETGDYGGGEEEEEQKPKDPWMGKDGFCKGYVDHRGKRFHGSLTMVVFEGMKRVVSLPIQDEETCTSPEVAATRLAEAKKKFAELGLDLTRTGTGSGLKRGTRVAVKEGRLAPYTLEFEDKTRRDDIEGTNSVRHHGVQRLFVRKGSARKQLLEHKSDKTFDATMGGDDTEQLSQVFVSPSGERVVVLGFERNGGMRGGYDQTFRVRAFVNLSESLVAAEAK